MIGDGAFQPQLERIEELLKGLGLLEERQKSPNKNLGAADFRGLTYREVFEYCFREYAYDFLLSDQSLLLFKKGGSDVHDGWLSYTYTEPPVAVPSYDEFVLTQFPQEDTPPSEILASWGDELRADYETQIGTANLKEGVTPIRYDYKASDYRRAVHPASHLHFGFDNEIRVAVPLVLTPFAFTLFILRQRYPHHWSTLVHCDKRNGMCKNLRETLEAVSDDYWDEQDKWEMFLT